MICLGFGEFWERCKAIDVPASPPPIMTTSFWRMMDLEKVEEDLDCGGSLFSEDEKSCVEVDFEVALEKDVDGIKVNDFLPRGIL